ncbi:hypothetical protein [Sphingomonas bacterium]|uniref:hypothetical protein n=1 Tax=Sphingomonas bacterium TaxID=1895847 RepID=UPI0015770D61|nr:hypothetical protein [Sphingomonas bacterium]
MAGNLFSNYFLDEGIALQTGWGIDPAALVAAREQVAGLIADFAGRAAPSEANTERDLIDPLLALLGWRFSVQERRAGGGAATCPITCCS